MKSSSLRWTQIVAGVGFLLVGLLHLIPWLLLLFVYRAQAIPESNRTYIPIYGLFGVAAVWMFLITIVLDFTAGLFLIASRSRGRVPVLAAAIMNLPLIPLGPIIGVAGILVVYLNRRQMGHEL